VDINAELGPSAKIGNGTKTFLFTYFYGYNTINNCPSYSELDTNELNRFFIITKEVSTLITRNQSDIREVYKEIELLNSIVLGG
jgi:hypothetical protein